MGGSWRVWLMAAVIAAAAIQLALFAHRTAEGPRMAVRRAAPADVLQARWRSGPVSRLDHAVPCPVRAA